MEFKDRLKEMRLRRGLSQSQLASAIYVSRSAVAKWENGLGLPGEESMDALITFFAVPSDYFSTQEPEVVIVEKNKRISRLSVCLISIFCIVGAIFLTITGLLIGGYRFTSASAVDDYYHKFATVRTEGYDFYFNDNTAPTGFETVKKCGPWLFKNIEAPMQELTATDGTSIGGLFTFPDRDCYHYIFCFTGHITEMGTTEDGKAYATVEYPYRTGSVTINGMTMKLDLLAYTAFSDPIERLEIKGEQIWIKDLD